MIFVFVLYIDNSLYSCYVHVAKYVEHVDKRDKTNKHY